MVPNDSLSAHDAPRVSFEFCQDICSSSWKICVLCAGKPKAGCLKSDVVVNVSPLFILFAGEESSNRKLHCSNLPREISVLRLLWEKCCSISAMRIAEELRTWRVIANAGLCPPWHHSSGVGRIRWVLAAHVCASAHVALMSTALHASFTKMYLCELMRSVSVVEH